MHYADKTAYTAIKRVSSVRTDCFAYVKGYLIGECDALRELYCKREKCKFYKNRDEYMNQLNELDRKNRKVNHYENY